jgi:hypothetical protein
VSSTANSTSSTATTPTPTHDPLPLQRGRTTGVWRTVLRAPPPAFPVHELTALLGQGRTDAALDLVFDRLDDLLLEGRFDACDAILRAVAPSQLPPVVAAGFLAATRAADDRLRDARALLRERIVESSRGAMSAEALEQLLAGL